VYLRQWTGISVNLTQMPLRTASRRKHGELMRIRPVRPGGRVVAVLLSLLTAISLASAVEITLGPASGKRYVTIEAEHRGLLFEREGGPADV